ncbi:hypothetical protein SAMN05216257_102332 [Meinhardsimonia xiamenensis]|uniref:Uncharacterized protein n=1 Tax=Meinhardsimonia xiamenensis TaxID=990712 RepID=A0A1G9AYV3_9RHOB|nr:hypothetical protein [Meinhardsimonia xiamenensis]PRX35192.1 hypothetical protein LV81_01787 [Meinhardsimonia xiamenensis]SDK32501.1 hypothetical protein SAMN05216257_102332 [Meinhardsimonia xiamenensis]
MFFRKFAALLLAGLALSAGQALAELAGDRVETSGKYTGVFAPRPGCCANAPWPTENLTMRHYVYPDGREVIVYPYKHGAGYQPFWWEKQ